ncbi:hypothetical protein PC129_g24260 [Phytophthora cactorum]|uniref:Uncharacterized protein n=1 Tax=Phytophthora cactorum TaxID=29920 RepID=A0A8T1GZA9_9STRA|nr:hypothetical protein PC111_g24348 [Phytophthora cactorum]KAG2791412.1 hypothetical protein PC112_g24251 [Phytophthora cactorum]KAG2870593.1 hypothetical protein PC114_g27314 [Phytophthora cactorum]KAG2873117.1 hypothetical protein PC115_g24438 [Phytophthora cactorum]KAG2956231.1 hypothetical protein PC118_g24559 [Phytophthora cactorum]
MNMPRFFTSVKYVLYGMLVASAVSSNTLTEFSAFF